MQLRIWFVLAAYCYLVSSTDIETDEGVLVLNKNNFQSAVSDNEYILVEFYAPWCGHCKALAPEYEKAAKLLEESGSKIKLAKIDATLETDIAEAHNVRGYPTLKFFKKGFAIDYSGSRVADGIVNWLKKKTGPPAKVLESVDDFKAFLEANPVVVIGFFKVESSENAETFLKLAEQMDSFVFGITSEPSVFEEYSVDKDNVVIFKKFDSGREDYDGEFEKEALKRFILIRTLPLVVEFNHDTAQKIFGGDIKSHLLLFLSKEAGTFDLIDSVKDVAKSFRDQVLFVSINCDDEDHQRILEFFGMKKSETPSMRLIKLEDEMAKYKPQNDKIEPENIKQFVNDFLSGNLKQHLLCEELPDDWNKNPVHKLVASNFDEVAFDKTKDVLVEFYAPWCGHCKQLAPIYDQLGEHFKNDDNIVIAKMDATANELEHTKISSFPTLKLYKSGDNKVVEYSGERTLEALIKFIEMGGEDQGGPEVTQAEEVSEEDETARKDEL